MTYPSQFFFFSLELNPSIEFPPKTRPWRHQSGRFYLFIRGCANSTNRGRRRGRKHRWIFFPSLCFRLESIPAQTRQTNRGRGGSEFFRRVTTPFNNGRLHPAPRWTKELFPLLYYIEYIYMCHRISFDETFNQTEPVARNVIRSCVFEEEWSKLRHCRRGGEGKDSFARK